MRWLLGLVLLLLALGTLRMVGCGDEGPECRTDEDCDDQYACTKDWCNGIGQCDRVFDFEAEGQACVGVKDACTYARCGYGNGECLVCESRGVAGLCYEGSKESGGRPVCATECQTDEECSDGLECTTNSCVRSLYSYDNWICAAYDTCNEDDGNECTEHRCDRDSGECVHASLDERSCGPCASSGPCFCIMEPCQGNICCWELAGVCRDGVCVVD